MALQRVVIPLNPSLGMTFAIPPDRLHYLQRVLRLRTGDNFIVMDGRERWLARLEDDQGIILEQLPPKGEINGVIHLGVGMPKGTGMELILKQTTEMGVSSITPIVSERTLLRPSASKIDRWQKIIQEAAELSCRSTIPSLENPVTLAEFLGRGWTHKFIGVTSPAPPLLTLLLSGAEIDTLALLTGPEGGWTPQEEKTTIEAGWQPMSLAPGVLSATTAPVVALAISAAALVRHFPT